MPTSEFRGSRTVLEPKLRAALLASSFSRFRKEHYRYPLATSSLLDGGVPAPVEEWLPKLNKQRPQSAREARVVHYIADSLKPGLEQNTRSGIAPLESDEAVVVCPHMQRRIDFDDNSWTTQVTVCSRFEVSEEKANTILYYARPPQWQQATPDFFKRSAPVVYDWRTGRIEVHPEKAEENEYQLYEHVEWDWSESTEGGIANILTIKQDKTSNRSQYARCIQSLNTGGLLAEEQRAGQLDDQALEQLVNKAFANGWPVVEYNFELFRSLRSKFVSNWEMGGLDLDDGAYVALWSPDTKRLYIKTNKRLRYSPGAGAIEGFSSMLNLLAPATVGMLLEDLAYQGILEFLNPDQGQVLNFSTGKAVGL